MSAMNFGCMRCLLCLTLEVGLLVIGVLFWVNGSSPYGQVITYETAEWGKGPVMDIILQHNSS